MVRLSLLRPGSAGRTHQKKSRGRARAIATTGALCSPALGEPDAYPAVSGGAGGAENRNAPNGTAALSFVANSEAARYVFVVVAAADVMIAGRRYDTFVLACSGVGITTGWGETEVFMEVSSRRLAIVQHRHPPARGLLSLISLLSAFLLTGIKRNQAQG